MVFLWFYIPKLCIKYDIFICILTRHLYLWYGGYKKRSRSYSHHLPWSSNNVRVTLKRKYWAMKSSSFLVAFLAKRDYILGFVKGDYVLSMVNHYEIIIWGYSCSVFLSCLAFHKSEDCLGFQIFQGDLPILPGNFMNTDFPQLDLTYLWSTFSVPLDLYSGVLRGQDS